VPDEKWLAFLRDLWEGFETAPRRRAKKVRMEERDDRTWLALPGELPLPFEDPWVLAEVLRYWLVELAVREAKGMVPFHAASLTTNGTGVLFAGSSGAGKTTLTLALAQAGWRLGGDDIAPIDESTGLVAPFPKPLNVREPATRARLGTLPRRVDWPPAEDGPPIVPAGSFERVAGPFAVSWLLFITYDPDETALFEAIPAGLAVTMAFEFGRSAGKSGVSTLARLCRGARAARLRYRSTAEALEILSREIPGAK
jgi:hypothetical protein